MNRVLNVIHNLRETVIPKCYKFTKTAFAKYLLITNVAISSTSSAVGDVLEQRYQILTGGMKQWDHERTWQMSASGCTVGIFCHFWYQALDKRYSGRKVTVVLKKLLVDQVIGSPLCIATFFFTLALLERPSFEEFKNEINRKAWRLYIAEWIIWPPAQFINFYFLPTRYRVLYDNAISLGYDIYTSNVKHNHEHIETKKNDVH